MQYLQAVKKIILEPISLTNGATASLTIDTLGADTMSVDVLLARTSSATNVPTVLKLQEADVTNTSSFADISGATGTSAFTSGSTTAGNIVKFDVTLVGARKRYLRLQVSPLTTQVVGAIATLGRLEQMPTTAANANVDGWVIL